MSDTTWLYDAACRRHDPDAWFAHATRGWAVHVCVTHCPVLAECRAAIDVIRPIGGVAAGVHWVPVGTRVSAPVRPSLEQPGAVVCAACVDREHAEALRRQAVAASTAARRHLAVVTAAAARRAETATRRERLGYPSAATVAARAARDEQRAARRAEALTIRLAAAIAAQARRDERAAQVAAAHVTEAQRIAAKHIDVAARKESVMRELAGMS